MTCANPPDVPVAAYCQFCGKPLCAQCVHKVNNIIACEPCLAARIGVGFPGHEAMSSEPLPPDGVLPPATCCNHPWLAFVLGWIPGVGAMYNGQFAKALVHVFIFAIFVDMANQNDAFGILVAAWIFYQVFDAYQTAVARRDGLPLPNPLGLNDAGQWFGARSNTGNMPYVSSTFGNAGNSGPFQQARESYKPSVDEIFGNPVAAVPPDPVDTSQIHRRVPVEAVVLIGLGVLFLLGNLGVLSAHWLERGWPLLLIGMGVWLIIRRTQTPPAGGAP